ncbi:MAG: hypothetical protein ACC662_00540, partial [Planctomycetota bacterium]
MGALGTALRSMERTLPLLVAALLVGPGLLPVPGVGVLFLAAFGATWGLVPYAAVLARRLGAMARPGGRALNLRFTPLLGGSAVLLPLLVGLGTLAVEGDRKVLGLAAGAVLAVVVLYFFLGS